MNEGRKEERREGSARWRDEAGALCEMSVFLFQDESGELSFAFTEVQ